MGSVVKSIGKAIKKVAKGIKKVIKKIGPALIVAAAVWMGVSALGAGVTGASGFGVSNFQAGLGKIGSGISGFFSPGGVESVASSGASVTQTLGQGTAGQATLDATAAASSGTANVVKKFVNTNMNMSTGDALIYMTKMNMLATGVQMVAGFLDDSEEKQLQAEVEAREHKYAYGAARTDEQKTWLEANPDWMSTHPSLMPSPNVPSGMQTQMAATTEQTPFTTATQPQMPMMQQIGQPTLGRQTTKNFETAIPRVAGPNQGGMISKGSQRRFV